jgi:hypothetical protein
MLIAVLALQNVLGGFTPAPAPTPKGQLPEIIHTVTSATCTTLHKATLPVGYVAKRNDEAFKAMATSIQKFLHGIYPTDVPTTGELQAALEQQDTTALTADDLGPDNEDDQLLYGPDQVLTAAKIDSVAQQIFENVTLEKQVIAQSLKQYPPGADAKVDAMRQRAQNLIDLQRALADKYEQFAGTYLGDQDMTRLLAGSSGGAQMKLFLRALLLGEAGALTGSGSDAPDGGNDVNYTQRYGDVAQIVHELIVQEHAFATETISLYNQCNGTNIIFATPAPKPTPSP